MADRAMKRPVLSSLASSLPSLTLVSPRSARGIAPAHLPPPPRGFRRLGSPMPCASLRPHGLHCPSLAGVCAGGLLYARGRRGQRRAASSGATAAERKDLPKYFDWKASEQRIYETWESSGCFSPRGEAEGTEGKFVMMMPPPNVTGALHMGHAMFVTIEDIMARFARMQGKDVLWLPGTDHAGIATQMVVEKHLVAQGMSRRDMTREQFVDKVWEWKRQYGGTITNQLRRLGASCDWERERFTLDGELSKAVAAAFTALHDKGLIYRGTYMVNWSPSLQTAVSDLEVEYRDEQGTLYYFQYPVAPEREVGEGAGEGSAGSAGESLPVATSRPETILGDTAVAVHPEDSRFAHLIGRSAVVPFTGRRVPIIGEEGVDREFGTGALKVTPAHDPNDYKLGKKHGLEFIKIMNKDGTLNAQCGDYAGMDRFAARERLWQDMQAQGLASKTEKYDTRVPVSQRGGEVIEPMVSEQWFVKMETLAAPALEAVRQGDVDIVPGRFEKVYNHWLEDIQDWCVSRQLWWGHRIPAWYVYASQAEAELGAASGHAGKPFVVAEGEQAARERAAEQFPEMSACVLSREEDVLDTWFSSSLWPFSTLGWPDQGSEDLKRFYPTSMLETGHDILFFWVARMIMMGIELTGAAPFKTVYLHGLIRDQQGRKMSKTLGNVIDPLEVIDQYGTDALRFTLATGTTPGQDLNLSLDKIEQSRNLLNKVWNASKFVTFCMSKLEDEQGYTWQPGRMAAGELEVGPSLPFAEAWVLQELARVAGEVQAAHERHDIGEGGRLVSTFFWGQFADWYVEIAKTRLYGADPTRAKQCMDVTLHVLLSSLKLLHPYMPFVTEEIWTHLLGEEGGSIMHARWPEGRQSLQGEPGTAEHALFATFQDAVRAFRNTRAEHQVPLNKQVPAKFYVGPEELRRLMRSEDEAMRSLCKIDELEYVELQEQRSLSSDDAFVETVVREDVLLYVPASVLVDKDQELARLGKQMKKLSKELQGLDGRLSSPSFVSKAPEEVVRSTTEKRDELAEQVRIVGDKLAKLGG